MFVLIGLPVYRREWILPAWFAAIEAQDFPLRDIGFIFLVAPDDSETRAIIDDFGIQHPEVRCFTVVEETNIRHQEHPVDSEDPTRVMRQWNYTKYHNMVLMRNDLLDRATCFNPDRYFSLDSDVLLENPQTISMLVELTEKYDAVAPLMYMSPAATTFPSVMSWNPHPGGVAIRRTDYPIGTLFKTDVIMAAKMMSKPVYQTVRYRFHRQGEDLGWSGECWKHHFELWSASYIYCPHIMNQVELGHYKRVGDTRLR